MHGLSYFIPQLNFTIEIVEQWGYWWCLLFAALTYLMAAIFGFISTAVLSPSIVEHPYGTVAYTTGGTFYNMFVILLCGNMLHLLAVAFKVQLTEHYSIRVSDGMLTVRDETGGTCMTETIVSLDDITCLEVSTESRRCHKHVEVVSKSGTIRLPYLTEDKMAYLMSVLDEALQINNAIGWRLLMQDVRVLRPTCQC